MSSYLMRKFEERVLAEHTALVEHERSTLRLAARTIEFNPEMTAEAISDPLAMKGARRLHEALGEAIEIARRRAAAPRLRRRPKKKVAKKKVAKKRSAA